MVKKKKSVKKVSKKNFNKDKKLQWVAIGTGIFLLLIMAGGILSTFNFALTGHATAETDLIKGIFSEAFNELFVPLAKLTFGVGAESGEIIFAKTLLFLALIGIIYSILAKIDFFEDKKGMALLAVTAFSILVVRFLTEEMIRGMIILPTDTFVVAMIVLLILSGFFYFIEVVGPFRNSPPFRKISWIIVACTFFGVWYTIRKDLGMAPLTYVIGGVVAIFLFWLDGTISKSVAKGKHSREKSNMAKKAIQAAKAEIGEWQKQLVAGNLTNREFNANMNRIDKATEALLK